MDWIDAPLPKTGYKYPKCFEHTHEYVGHKKDHQVGDVGLYSDAVIEVLGWCGDE